LKIPSACAVRPAGSAWVIFVAPSPTDCVRDWRANDGQWRWCCRSA